MVIYLKQQLLRVLFILLVLIIVYGGGYYLSYIRYNDFDIVELNGLRVSNENLKKELSDIQNSLGIHLTDHNIIITKTIRRNIYNFYNEIVLKKENDLIQSGDPVINGEGLIGIVDNITDDEVFVKLLTGDYNVSVKVNDSYGYLNNGMITMLDKYKEINIGDKVYTSGLTNVMGDILVGEIVNVVMNEDDTNKLAKIKLIDNSNLNYVGIVSSS